MFLLAISEATVGLSLSLPGVPRKVLRLTKNRTKYFRPISVMLFVSDKRDANLDFDILFFSVK